MRHGSITIEALMWPCHVIVFFDELAQQSLQMSLADWSLRTMREKLVKIGAKVVSHARYVTFQMAEVLVSKSLFCEILERIKRLRPIPVGYG